MNNYRELEAEVEARAEKEFQSANPGPGPDAKFEEVRRYRRELQQFVRDAVEKWVLASELHSSIVIRRERSVEIADAYYGSSITVYPPERDHDWSSGEKKIRIKPAYINASTWSTGPQSVEHVQRRTQQYLKMVEIAIDEQNRMNQVVVDWPDMISPFDQARWDHDEVLRYREAEKQKRDAEAQKKAEKLAKKVR